MAQEIERKFLINQQLLGELPKGITIKQAYIPTADKTVVRIRISDDKAFLTLKGANKGLTRSEFEYPIPVTDAEAMIEELCTGPIIDKTRYLIPQGKHTWELDIFYGDNDGLVVAEIELESEDEAFDKPEWLGKEVTGDARYYNSCLLDNPYKHWK